MYISENNVQQGHKSLVKNNDMVKIGLNGTFKEWFLNALDAVADFIYDTGVGGFVGKTIVLGLRKYFPNVFNRVIGDENLTIQEQNLLTDWDDTEYKPFFIQLVKDAELVFKSTNLKDQLLKANSIINKICAYKKYSIGNPRKFNFQTLQVQNQYLNNTTSTIEAVINQNFDANNTIRQQEITIDTDLLNLNIIPRGFGKIICSNYVSKLASNTTPVQNNQVPIVVNGEVLDTPVKTETGYINPATGEVVTDPFKKSYIVPGIAILLLAFAFLSGKKKKK
jgi:hypothetical protein